MPACYAYGCTNGSHKSSCRGIRYFRIPSSQREQERRRLWIAALRRKGDPYTAARVCSDHFVSGAPAKWYEVNSPDYVPSIFNFPTSHKQEADRSSISASYDRYKRAQRRQAESGEAMHYCDDQLNSVSEPQTSLWSTVQDELLMAYDDEWSDKENCHSQVETAATKTTEVQTEDAATNTEPAMQHADQVSSLRVLVDMFIDKNTKLEEECKKLKADIADLRGKGKASISSDIMGDELKFKFYSGLPSVACFLFLLQALTIAGFKQFRKMTIDDTLLVLLMKLKLGLKNRDIAYRFGIHCTYVSTILTSRLPILADVAKTFIVWPTRDAIMSNMPNCFRTASRDIRRTRVIVDCFEVFTERPKSLVSRAQLWSNYKGYNTIKFLIGIAPTGSITFLSDAWGGRASDKVMSLQSDLLDLVDPFDVIMADRGFLIKDECALLNVKVITPHFTRGRKQMTQQQIQESRRLARVRIHVERVIGRLRRQFCILSGVLPLNLLPQADNIAVACAGILNLHKPVV